jgi:Flp pilus assembly pilin Flp
MRSVLFVRRTARHLKDEAGLTTAEYAVGTVAVAGLGGLLLKLLTSDPVRDLLWGLFSSALSSFFG